MSHTHHDHQHPIDPHDLGHMLPFKTYLTVFISLLFLTFITVAVTRLDLGWLNIVVAMGVASLKAGLVALFFMHLRYENPLTWAYVAFPLILLAILLGSIFTDTPYRFEPGMRDSVTAEQPKAEAH